MVMGPQLYCLDSKDKIDYIVDMPKYISFTRSIYTT
uniref:Uncharacterized protein n=1 Tax=Rhizophora mucronata TaxID=61149 RepID=A0A2P2NM16_RHIMU